MTLALTLAALVLVAPFSAYQVTLWNHQLRERLMLGLGWASTGAMLGVEPGLAILLGLAVWRWRTPATMGGVLIIGATCGLYAVVAYGPVELETLLPVAIVVSACVPALLGVVQSLRARRDAKSFHEARDASGYLIAGRVILAILCAIAAPLAPLWALPILGLGLIVTASYVGLAAALAGLLVAHPGWALPVLACAVPVAAVVWLYRGGATDSWRERLRVWRFAAATLARGGWPALLVGLGHGAWGRSATWWSRGAGLSPERFVHAHNDLVQVGFEYGLVGVCGILLWGASLARGVSLGDPLTGALVAGLIGAVGQFPCHAPQTGIPLLAVAGLIARRMV